MDSLAKKLLFFYIIYVSLIAKKCLGAGCPPADKIYPCRCRESSENYLECNNLTGADQFARILNNSRNHDIVRLTIERSSMEYIPKEAFSVESLKSIRIAYNDLDRLFEESPRNSAVNTLWIKKTHLREGFNWRSLSTLTQLEWLSLTSIPLEGTLDLKYVSKKLKYLSLYQCRVKNLQDNIFQDFKKLEQIYILKDSISSLKRSMFPRPAKLNTLSFTDTEISGLPDDLFEDMPDLKQIDFSNNQLTVLSENTFRPVLRAQISFRGNLLTCDCGMEWVLNASRNRVFGGCNSPEGLKGRELSSLNEEDFDC